MATIAQKVKMYKPAAEKQKVFNGLNLGLSNTIVKPEKQAAVFLFGVYAVFGAVVGAVFGAGYLLRHLM